MFVVSVNVGKEKSINSKSGKSGIFKEPVIQPVVVDSLGLEHDVIIDVENHGGVDQAVYVYGTTDYAWWAEQLKHPLEPGTFGENLTIADLEAI